MLVETRIRKEMQPLISIIVPIFNAENYLSYCLDSLIGQTMRDIEIICINDGSTDRSLEILNHYASRDSRIIVINQPNAGVSTARNNALKYVKGEYYMFVDSDDWLDLETCKVTYCYAKKYDADCLMFSYVKEFRNHNIVNHIFDDDIILWVKDDVKQKFHRRLFGPVGEELSRPQDLDILVTPCMQLFRTVKFSELCFHDIREIGTFEDGLYQMDVYRTCSRFLYVDHPFYHYRKTNSDSITSRYKADLYDKWQHLYDEIKKNIDDWSLPNIYSEALNNRIAMGIIGLGLNQTHSQDGIWSGRKRLNNILKETRYKQALGQLKLSQMPILWKLFFILAKWRMTTLLFLMLKVIEYFRIHKN